MSAQTKQFPENCRKTAFLVLFSWLLGWFLKADFYLPYLFREIVLYPMDWDFFPFFFRSPLVLQFFYLLPLVALIALFSPKVFHLRMAGLLMTFSAVMLLWGQDTHNDMTFLTSFWVGGWFWWFVCQDWTVSNELFVHARSLALCLIGVIFLGGFIGKVTPEYWSGEVFANIFLSQNFGWVGQWIRGHFSHEEIRLGFQWAGKIIIISEGMLVFAPIWPYRLTLWLGLGVMCSISLFTTWRIFSVLFCLMGLLYALKYLPSAQYEIKR